VVFADKPERVKSCPDTNAEELDDTPFAVVTGVEVPYQATLVAGSLVVHCTCDPLAVVLAVNTFEIIGVVVSGINNVVNER